MKKQTMVIKKMFYNKVKIKLLGKSNMKKLTMVVKKMFKWKKNLKLNLSFILLTKTNHYLAYSLTWIFQTTNLIKLKMLC